MRRPWPSLALLVSLQAASLRESDQAGWYCELGGHALYDVALNLVFLGLQSSRVGRLPHALEEERLSKLQFST